MKIGIDLDNTIIDYSKVFLPALEILGLKIPYEYNTKDQIKKYLLSLDGGQELWERVQGYIYGPIMNIHAQLYPGLLRFLWRCKNQGHQVDIVSHKSIFGHYSSQDINIRDCASIFLEKYLVYTPGSTENLVDSINFLSSKDEKIEFIKSRNYDLFIDDLPDIVEKLAQDPATSIVYFSPSGFRGPILSEVNKKIICLSDWISIDFLVNGDYTLDEVATLSTKAFDLNIKDVIKIGGGRNALVFQLNIQDGSAVKLKIYRGAESQHRLSREFSAMTALAGIQSKYSSRPIAKSQSLEMALYEWVPGSSVKEYSKDDIFYCLEFLGELKSLSNSFWRNKFGYASAACFCYSDIKLQIFSRINELQSLNSCLKLGPELNNFLEGEFLAQFEYFQGLLIADKASYKLIENKLPEHQRVLSPSDFGSHNAIRSYGNDLVFIDFEYFGYDDPAKLICDFMLHPAMDLTIENQHLWLEGAVLLYGEKVWKRVKAVYPFFALIWVLIIIKNKFRTLNQSEYQVATSNDLIIDDWVRFQYLNNQIKKLQNISQRLK